MVFIFEIVAISGLWLEIYFRVHIVVLLILILDR